MNRITINNVYLYLVFIPWIMAVPLVAVLSGCSDVSPKSASGSPSTTSEFPDSILPGSNGNTGSTPTPVALSDTAGGTQGDSGDPNDPNTGGGGNQPPISVVPDDLEYGEALNELSLVIRREGFPGFGYIITSDVPWVAVSPAFGKASGESQTVMVRVNRAGLTPGQYNATVSIQVGTKTTHVAVHLTINEPPRDISVLQFDTYLLDFGTGITFLSFKVSNVSDEPCAYTLTPSRSWFELYQEGGELNAQEENEILVSINRCKLGDEPAGLHEAQIEVRTGGGQTYTVTVSVDVPEKPSNDAIADLLSDLPPLPKVHYSWPVNLQAMGYPQSDLAYQWVRITGAIGLSARWTDAAEIRKAVALCLAVETDHPEIQPRIALEYTPYCYDFPQELPPTYTGPEVQEELDLCESRLALVRSWLAGANADLNADVRVESVLLDCEVTDWFTHENGESDAAVWNAALVARYNAIYDICKSIFPDANVDWYVRGRPCCYRRFTTQERGDSYGPCSYWPCNLADIRWHYANAYDLAQQNGVDRLLMWISLGSSYVYFPGEAERGIWSCDYEYDQSYSWALGSDLNDPIHAQIPGRAANWNSLDAAVFFPGPGDARATRYLYHFVNYVRGAHGLPLLDLP